MKYFSRTSKDEIISDFEAHVSSGKVEFYTAFDLAIILGKRNGPWIYDVSGMKRLLNCHCNGGVFNLGHRHLKILEVMMDALAELDIGNHHLISEQRAELEKKLSENTSSEITRTVFGVGGGEANDSAIKLARGYTKRHKIIYAKSAYHG